MKLKKVLSAAAAVVLCFMIFGTSAFAADAAKTETVYASLYNDGSVKSIYVVNHLTGSYTDYGTYTDIKNLSSLSEPVIEGDKITFPDEVTDSGLYYQGTASGELPMTFQISYYIDGSETEADSLAGASGHLKIVIDYAPNDKCDKKIRDGLMAQMTAVFSTDSAANISADGATLVTVGQTVTSSYIIMPEQSGVLVFEADVTRFEMDPITITMLKNALSVSGISTGISEFENGMNDMVSGADEMVDGTSELKDGMKTLAGKAGQLNKGLQTLSETGVAFGNGLAQFKNGLDAYAENAQTLKAASEQALSGLRALAQNGASVSSGISAVSGQLSALANGSADLKALAQVLSSSADPQVQALAAGTLQMIGGIQGLSDGLQSAADGMSSYTAGVGEAAKGYEELNSGIAQMSDAGGQLASGFDDISSSFAQYRQGVSQSAEGFKKLYFALRGLPSSVQELIDGQIEFKDGIVSAKNEIIQKTDGLMNDDEPAVSFASPDKNHPESVQYILTTPGIKIRKTEEPKKTEENESFFTRLAGLFN